MTEIVKSNSQINFNEKEYLSAINSYLERLGKLEIILGNDVMKGNNLEHLIERVKKLKTDIKERDYQIAIIGAIKAGKSTMINSVLGVDLASVSVTPETASLTRFTKAEKLNYVKVTFFEESDWNDLEKSVEESNSNIFKEKFNALNGNEYINEWVGHSQVFNEFTNLEDLQVEIKKWTSCTEVTHYFVKEVEVGLCDIDLPKGVVLVDTPGLDDPVQYRSDITRKYIASADSVFVCVNSSALTGGEIATISRVFANARYKKDKLYIIGTQLDSRGNPLDDWAKQKAEWVFQLGRVGHFNDEELANNNIIGISAYLENLCRKYMDTKSDEFIDDIFSLGYKFCECKLNDLFRMDEVEAVKFVREKNNFASFKSKLHDEVIDKHREVILSEFKEEFEILMCDLKDKLMSISTSKKELLTRFDAKKNELTSEIKECRREIKKIKLEQAKIKDIINKFRTNNISKRANIVKELKADC
ncbi:MAG: dynamin family protein [Sarcina sp.]